MTQDEYTRDLFQIALCSSFHDLAAGYCRTRESYFVDVRMRGQSSTTDGAEGRNSVNYTRGEAIQT
jgi:hypothetical protein